FEQQEAAVLRGLVSQLEDMLTARAEEAPQDELFATLKVAKAAFATSLAVRSPGGRPAVSRKPLSGHLASRKWLSQHRL
ncbi:DUF2017 family protein, partial [Amycolatopsis japonica]|uniref:DUF2017 family protein n=1 Tax=Amycolatopsis japonica TaxID=208439 RepID=UPI0033C6E1B9